MSCWIDTWSNVDFWGFQRAMVYAENCANHVRFVGTLVVAKAHPSEFLTRAVNILRACRCIFQPRWGKGRWRSTT